MSSLLEIEALTIAATGRPLLSGVSVDVELGSGLALVGGSGSGKTTLLRACMGLLPPGFRVSGRIGWQGRDLLRQSGAQWRRTRGREISWIPQEPSAALDPRRTALQHLREGGARAEELAAVGIEPARAREYPFQWSGGMQQRLLVALALARRSALLLADEPTSALDSIEQARLLALLAEWQQKQGFAMIFVTHDLAVASQVATRVAVLQRGAIVEHGEALAVLRQPRHEHTRILAACQPRWAAWREV